MNARELISAQLNKLFEEKKSLVNQILENEQENIAEIRQTAADEAEAQYKLKVEVQVANQFRIAEQHLNSLLEALPAEEIKNENTEDNIDEETLI